jgi:beta-lactamase class A
MGQRTATAIVLVSGFLLLSTSVSGSPEEPSLTRLREAVAQVVEGAPGEMGVAIEHLESGESIEVEGDVRFPMASTFKLAVLAELFHQADEGKIRLDEMVSLGKEDVHIGSGELHDFLVPGVALSIENLAMIMMRVSDNSAADKLLGLVGVDEVNGRLSTLEIQGISVDRTCQRLILDWLGMAPERTEGMTYQEIEDFLNAYKPAPGELSAAAAVFEKDPRDTATPAAMNRLLRAVFTGAAASDGSTHRMIEILLACETGKGRIQGLLPKGTQVAHKTGTLGGTVDDVGIMYLPEAKGHIAISVLSRGMTDRDAAERAIAEIARYAYDYFLLARP